VEAIKEAIQNGNYPLDARKIAESMAGLEKLIGG
jgi:anti-sigma28 factor (negative regulator of flagellin synthesis)